MKRTGFSLVETLVVIAIIGILAAMYLPALSRARHKAVQTANMVGIRDEGISQMAGNANGGGGANKPTREEARQAFRANRGAGYGNGNDVLMSKMLYVVGGDGAFSAYWNTLLNPANNAPLEYDGDRLKAKDENGNEYLLEPVGYAVSGRVTNGNAPLEWEFLSTDLSETSSGSMGTNVLFPDGHVQYIAYPGDFPATRTVAELSHRFMGG